MSTGWIKLHRQLLDWEWYADINVTRLFVHLLLTANHKEKKWRGITIKKGQTITSQEALCSQTGLSRQQLRTSLNRLKSTNEITIKTSAQHTVISMNNWHDYQDANQATNQPLTNEQPTTNQQLTTNKNDKNDKNDKKVVIKDIETCEQVTIFEPEKFVEPVDQKTEKKLSKAAELNNQALDVFNYWRDVMRKPRTKHSPERLTAIKARLKQGFTVETIKQAIDGCKATGFNMGDNPAGKQHNDLTLICRNSVKLESFLPENHNVKTENKTEITSTDSPGWENNVNWEF